MKLEIEIVKLCGSWSEIVMQYIENLNKDVSWEKKIKINCSFG